MDPLSIEYNDYVAWCIERMVARGGGDKKKAIKNFQALAIFYACVSVKRGKDTLSRDAKAKKAVLSYKNWTVPALMKWLVDTAGVDVPAWVTAEAMGKTKSTNTGDIFSSSYCQ